MAKQEKQPENWGAYPEPHYDEYDECMCPDHIAMRQARQAEEVHRWLTSGR